MRQPRRYYVYILGSLSGTLYIGVTGKFERRLLQHKEHRYEGFTRKYEVTRLLCWESYDDVHKAIAREKQLKGWRREKKIALIESLNPRWLDLSREWYESVVGRDASTPPDNPQADCLAPLSMTKITGRLSSPTSPLGLNNGGRIHQANELNDPDFQSLPQLSSDSHNKFTTDRNKVTSWLLRARRRLAILKRSIPPPSP